MPERKVCRRGRQFYTTERDDAAFEELLKSAFPNVVFAYIDEWARSIRYLNSLLPPKSLCNIFYIHGWLPVRRWRPRWALSYPDNAALGFKLTNLPSRFFVFQPCSRFEDRPARSGLPFKTISSFGFLNVGYDVDDLEAKRFVNKVYRLLDKVMTNRVMMVDPIRGEVIRIGPCMDWVGFDALETCRRHPDHLINCGGPDKEGRWYCMAPVDWQGHRPAG